MHKKHKHDIIVVAAVLGFGISLYLSITHYLGYVVPCDLTHGCETVLNSKYSMLFGLPLAVWGVGYFTSVIISALLANHYAVWRKILTGLLSVGALAVSAPAGAQVGALCASVGETRKRCSLLLSPERIAWTTLG